MLNIYQPQEFEKKWAEEWDKNKTYRAPKPDKKHKKQFIFPMFPYPSGSGLHVGHVRVYTGTDVVARFYRMNQYAVLHPMGWDAFGLPAENAAIKAKKNPMDMVPDHIATFKCQMKSLGFSFDWDREFATTDPSYYKWTQWLFLQFYKMGLLYKKNAPINFCPFCKTGLSEEEVLPNGTHERCGNKIEKKDLPQWLFKITSYAERLLLDLKGLDWPRGILEMQKNWIGKSEGVNLEFKIQNSELKIKVFTTALDTVFGVTFMVLSPEHPLINQLITDEKKQDVNKYISEAKTKSNLERESLEKDKTGVFTGSYCINPINKQKIPIWVADYVLMSYGTGAVMGVPGHDGRDHEFAEKYKLEIKPVLKPTIDVKIESDGFWNYEEIKTKYFDKSVLFNSGEYDGLTSIQGKKKMIEFIEKNNFGQKTVTYHLRDWIFSRQRYWGEPIPIIICKKCGLVPVPEDQLPVELPKVKSYEATGTGESPLAAISDWVNVQCPKCGEPAKRETDTMPNWAGSCWYFIRFAQYQKSKIKDQKDEPSIENWKLEMENSGDWLPTDWYIGGAEHAVLHLLYARFWVKALYDLKLLDFKEPFTRLRNLGMILAEDHRKMSKSLGNVINPDDVQKEYGADALRIYEMFMAPFDQEISWSTKALQGSFRFITRVWKIYQQYQKSNIKDQKEDEELVVKLKKTIQKITSDIPEVKFNTSIAAMMEFINEWENKTLSEENAKKFLQVLAPFAPFSAEEIWSTVFGEKQSIHLSVWPKIEGDIVAEETILPIQVNGKLRSTLRVSKHEASKDMVEKKALQDEKVMKYINGKEYRIIYVPGKIINFIT